MCFFFPLWSQAELEFEYYLFHLTGSANLGMLLGMLFLGVFISKDL